VYKTTASASEFEMPQQQTQLASTEAAKVIGL